MAHFEPFRDPRYALRLTPATDHLRVEVSGDIDAQPVRIAYWRQIAEEAKARGLRKVLVHDRRKGAPASPAELAELAQLFRGEAVNFDRVAVVEPSPEFLPAVEHAEIFGQAAGINVRIFTDAQQAERWLRYGSPDDEPAGDQLH
ncbi:STAS/SEC14 domain-containing protein [Agrilutibacter solisilvae]|uniref:STAS/SEC14 domain-containing protein n=1 Tax=Agrilutibacter solisilvae TaxID=2763317 RepID=A0A974XZH7_9GAMM|nr:STAS/SEC14 domain-containing protein [Lysobacter solisilvae]QSX77810.1 STAS/SEC14 domain-containing protein [Lysobacter solisilvae]